MLQLKNIYKSYHVSDSTTHALDNVTVSFRNNEFVAILGPSGSGKTTLLNIIGGLDRYDKGNMIINGTSTQNFTDTDWDAYRNNSIGFVFQNYNLISHLSIIANVELGMTLSGLPAKEKHQRAIDMLTEVGLKKHLNKRPEQLSGGQMQRVAIARALANNPDILLCDEPTGALDTKTSEQIMKLIKRLSKKRLVIMVTHNPEIAQKYATRIVNFQDGKIIKDSNPYNHTEQEDNFKLKRTKMSYWNAIKLSFTNIMTKKGRTALTAFAASIGIISIAIVLAISNGFQKQIDMTMSKSLAKYPVIVNESVTNLNEVTNRKASQKNVKSRGYIQAEKDKMVQSLHINKITSKYTNYIKKINPDYANNISYQRGTNLNLIAKVKGKVERVSFSPNDTHNAQNSDAVRAQTVNVTGLGSSVFPTTLSSDKQGFLKSNYELLSGNWPHKATDLVIVTNNKDTVNINALKNLGYKLKIGDKIKFKQLLGQKFKIVSNNDYYEQTPTGIFVPQEVSDDMYNNSALTLRVKGIIRPKSENAMSLLSDGIAYSDNLAQKVIKINQNSDIIKAQKHSSHNVLTGQSVNYYGKKRVLESLGSSTLPSGFMIYPNNFKSKDQVLDYLDNWNKGKSKANKIIYTDMSSVVTSMTGGIINGITTVLIAFAAISLVTSMIMIGILTYTSVLERTKEIGILKALGARKKDITRVFDAETFILGIFSGILGIAIAYILTFPINNIFLKITGLTNVAQPNPLHILSLIIISTVLTLLGGHIPARIAAKKDAAIALRSE
ncbi:ATP-binding cassette domain-containing protein [Lactobacillus sp. ESL0785]|uniref:ABC transporter ATP-binding protein/permease n=1 Tax=Lactobacillus sp. ESL0785 TaxID=2983232 RepID=UPI0023F9A072|nr:ABC transporter ATP-binding protein/permease [Lactobacillus sp. ESL0785]WEV70846.1 ATP-binding cassette domain-containing protein [Lactobacillus sp. ESL0785]